MCVFKGCRGPELALQVLDGKLFDEIFALQQDAVSDMTPSPIPSFVRGTWRSELSLFYAWKAH